MIIFLTQLHTECKLPPEGSFVSWEIQSSYKTGKLLIDTKVKYECAYGYSLKWGENDVRVCEKDGIWDDNTAPKCIPR